MIEIKRDTTPIAYPAAIDAMNARVEDVINGKADELIWFLEHEPVYTAGTSARKSDLLDPRFPVHETGRGGQYTYHGPGQQIVYFVLDLNKRGQDLRQFVRDLEQIVIDTLNDVGVTGERREGRVGVWVVLPDGREEKIAAIGVRVRKWVTSHGLSLNIDPDLSHYTGIVPCGVAEHGVTSLKKLGIEGDVHAALLQNIKKTFEL